MKKHIKAKSCSKRTGPKKKQANLGKISKQEKKFHRKVKFKVPLKKNPSLYNQNEFQPKKQQQMSTTETETMDNEDNDDLILPLDMLSDEENEPVNIPTDDEDDNEHLESYERLPRSSFNNSNQQRALLPIKTDRGQLIAQSAPIIEPKIRDHDTDNEIKEEEKPLSSDCPVPSSPPKSVSVVELMAEREKKLNETKQTIVTLCDLIMKNPYEEIFNLKQLRLLLNLDDPLISMTIRKLTILSLVELFRDIVPDYRIRSLKEQNKDENDKMKIMKNRKKKNTEILSKDVKIIRHFEQTLLKHYQYFLHFLEQCAKKNLPDNYLTRNKYKTIEPAKLNLGHLSIQCLCKLLSYLHHFNFRNNLLNVIVQFMASRYEKYAYHL